MELIFKFFSEFCFEFEFFFNFDFQMHKTHLISFVFEISTLNRVKIKLEHFESDIHFCQDIWYTVTLRSERNLRPFFDAVA